MYLCELLVTEQFERGRLAVLCRDQALKPVYTVRNPRLLHSGAAFHSVFPTCFDTPCLEVGLEAKPLEYLRKTILVVLPSQPKPGSTGKLAKGEKRRKKRRRKIKKGKKSDCQGSLPAWLPSQGDLEKHLNVSEVIQTRPTDFHSLFSVGVQPSELHCH